MKHAISPSQVKTYRDCPRKWWYASVLKLPQPSSEAAEFGSRVHDILERCAATKVPPSDETKEGQVALYLWKAFSEYLPEWYNASPVVEDAWKSATAYDLPARGRSDLVFADRSMVVDWKTTSNLRYALTPEDAASDPQVLMYIRAYVENEDISLPATFVHVYATTRTKTPRTRVVETKIDDDALQKGEVYLHRTITAMERDSTAKEDEVRQVVTSCKKYGGCPFKEECFGKRKEEKMDMSIFEKARAKQAAALADRQNLSTAKASVSVNPPETQTDAAKGPRTSIGDVLTAQVDTKPTKNKPSSVLYVGCGPMGTKVTHFDVWIEGVAATICADLAIPHYLAGQYSEGEKAVAVAVALGLRDGSLKLPEHMYISAMHPLSKHLLPTLIRYATETVTKWGA